MHIRLGRIGSGASLWPLVVARAVGTLGLVATGLASRVSFRPPAAAVGPILGAGAADVIANLLYVLAVQRAPLSLVATLVSLAPASTVLLAQLVLREKLSGGQRAGVALALLAVAEQELVAVGVVHQLTPPSPRAAGSWRPPSPQTAEASPLHRLLPPAQRQCPSEAGLGGARSSDRRQ